MALIKQAAPQRETRFDGTTIDVLIPLRPTG
jgi:hypothetical protein